MGYFFPTFPYFSLLSKDRKKKGKRKEKEQPQKKKEQPQKEKNRKRTEKKRPGPLAYGAVRLGWCWPGAVVKEIQERELLPSQAT